MVILFIFGYGDNVLEINYEYKDESEWIICTQLREMGLLFLLTDRK